MSEVVNMPNAATVTVVRFNNEVKVFRFEEGADVYVSGLRAIGASMNIKLLTEHIDAITVDTYVINDARPSANEAVLRFLAEHAKDVEYV